MKTPVEKAYDYGMKVVEEIKEHGITVKVVVPRRVREGKHHDVAEKYPPPEYLPVAKWRHVTLVPKTKEESNLVYEKVTELRELGIGFDTGGCSEGRDWEFDWSFSFKEGGLDTEPLEILEDLIKEVGFK